MIKTILITLLAFCPAFCATERDIDLADTLAWMDQTYNPYDGGSNYGRGHGWKEEGVSIRHETFIPNGCTLTLYSEWGQIQAVHPLFS